MTMLRTESLCFCQGAFVLRDVSLDCPEGKCLALLGPSGSGKTTCLEIMAGLRHADSGRVWIDGCDVTDVPPEKRAVSYLPQDVALFPHLSVRENILFPARMRGLAPDAQRLDRLCGMLGILPISDRADVRSLSGGEAQRVAIARALLVPPRVLFLDECFGSLDAPLRRRLARQFRDLREMTGTTTVMVTHDTEEACLMADRLAILDRGSVQQIGTPGELYRQPATVRVAELLGMQNILPVRSCRPCEGYWRCDLGGIELLTPLRTEASPAPQCLGFFGWDILSSRPGVTNERSDGINRLRLRVVDCAPQGHGALLRLSTDSSPQAVLEAQWRNQHDSYPACNEMVDVHIPADRIHAWSEANPSSDRMSAVATLRKQEWR